MGIETVGLLAFGFLVVVFAGAKFYIFKD